MNAEETKLILEFVAWLYKRGILITWQYVAQFSTERREAKK